MHLMSISDLRRGHKPSVILLENFMKRQNEIIENLEKIISMYEQANRRQATETLQMRLFNMILVKVMAYTAVNYRDFNGYLDHEEFIQIEEGMVQLCSEMIEDNMYLLESQFLSPDSYGEEE